MNTKKDNTMEQGRAKGRLIPLTLQFSFVWVVLFILGGVLWSWLFYHSHEEAMLGIEEQIVHLSSEKIAEISLKEIDLAHNYLTASTKKFVDQQQKQLADIPFDLYRGEEARIKAAILAESKKNQANMLNNISVLQDILKEDAKKDIQMHIQRLKHIQYKSFLKIAKHNARDMFIFSIISVILVALVIFFVIHFFLLKRIHRLRNGVLEIADGNYEQQLSTKGFPDEIQDLTASFNVMAANLCNQEQLVKEQTASLKQEIDYRIEIEREKEQLNNKLLQAYKMEAIGTLAGGIAHDFNNILGVIIGYVGLAKEIAPPSPGLDNSLANVLIASDRAKELVSQILAFSRQTDVECIVMKAQPLIKEGLKLIRSSIPTTISIVTNIDPKTKIIEANPTQVHQILINLCTNASHSMEETGGILTVSLKPKFIQTDEQQIHFQLAPGEYAELVVTDTGNGIAPDVIGKIFGPYFTTKEEGKGTGMGLAIIQNIILDYGGSITVESQLGKGATFHVLFPVAKKEALPKTKEQENIPKGQEHILFVDDEELLIKVGKDILETLGYQVTIKQESSEALKAFNNQPDKFDLVITDQTMPDMTGLELAKKILQIRPDIPIILCTGYSALVDENVAKAHGIKEFLLKPMTKNAIAKLIRQALKANK